MEKVKSETKRRYHTKKDHLFVLTGPSGAGKHEIATLLEDQGVADFDVDLNLKHGIEGIKTVVDGPAITEVLRNIMPKGHITVIYINAPYDRRYSRMAYHERKEASHIRQLNKFDESVYRACKVDYVINSQDTIGETTDIVKRIIESHLNR